jgi:hypothetical protein
MLEIDNYSTQPVAANKELLTHNHKSFLKKAATNGPLVFSSRTDFPSGNDSNFKLKFGVLASIVRYLV